MALYDDIISQQTSQYPGNVLEISIPPLATRLERYPGEAQSGQQSPMILDRLRQRPPMTLDQLLQTQVVPTTGGDSGAAMSRLPPQPFGFHPMYSEPTNTNLWEGMGLPAWMHPYYQQLQRYSNVLPNFIKAQERFPRTVLEDLMRRQFRTLFTGTPFTAQDTPQFVARHLPGFAPNLPGRETMGRAADVASNVASQAVEMSAAFPVPLKRKPRDIRGPNPEEILGMKKSLPKMAEDFIFGTEWRKEQEMRDRQEMVLEKMRMKEHETEALNRQLPTGELHMPTPNIPTTRRGPFADVPTQWYEQKYGGTDYLERYADWVRRHAGRPTSKVDQIIDLILDRIGQPKKPEF